MNLYSFFFLSSFFLFLSSSTILSYFTTITEWEWNECFHLYTSCNNHQIQVTITLLSLLSLLFLSLPSLSLFLSPSLSLFLVLFFHFFQLPKGCIFATAIYTRVINEDWSQDDTKGGMNEVSRRFSEHSENRNCTICGNEIGNRIRERIQFMTGLGLCFHSLHAPCHS